MTGFEPPHTAPGGRPGTAVPPPGGAPTPWGIGEAVLVVALFAVSQPLVSLLAVAAAGGPLPGDEDSPEAVRLLVVVLPVVVLVSHAIGWGLVLGLLRRHRLGLAAGLSLRPWRRPGPAAAFLTGVALQFITNLLVLLSPPPEDMNTPMMQFAQAGPWALALLAVMAVVLAPLLEETLFRGVLFPALRQRLRFTGAALLVTLAFAALHAFQNQGYWPALVAIFITGWVLALVRERTGSLWPCILVHAGFNFTAVLPFVLLGGKLPEEGAWPAWLAWAALLGKLAG